ncbi:hypothetical protein VitviT2T_018593 [Vitis vinifera]|uniref:Disease resistance-like protein CSA1 n=1 Tax=Vitis vinifera TaxID=29760 RepID=A0ABY9CZY9_VITVI|nr:hypothetical protein VitviT2T_018593 [Vitis vinifera]
MDNLSELSLKGTAIKGLPLSIEYLNGLALFNLEECKSLESLPGCIFKLKSLKTLILSNCLRLKKLPEIQENMESLKELFLDDTGLRELPSSIEHLNGLVLLKLKNCKRLASLPESICKLTSLQTLTLSGCSELKKLPDDMGSLQCLLKLKANGSGIQEVPSSITLLTRLQVLSLAGCKGGGSKSRNLALSLRASPTDGLRLSSLTVLHSLKKLNLSDRNLLEGALPSDLSSLSWLECLDLSRNNFITVPTSLSRLPHLRRLIVEHCKNLQSLPELPSSIKELLANDCTSLETFSYPSSAYPLRKFGDFNFEFSNCFRLVGNEQSDTVEAILQEIRLVASIQKSMAPSEHSARYGESRYDAVVPGSRIPEWFTHQSEGDSITVELPPGCYNTNSIGLAACAVFHPKFSMGKIGRSAYFSVNESGGFSLDNTTSMHFSKADHIWFGYRLISGVDLRDHLKVAFATSKVPGEVVKKCGVRLVYEQDEMGNASFLSAPCGREKEMNQIQSQETDTAASFSKLPPKKVCKGRFFNGNICKLTALQTLTLSGCTELKKLPDEMESLQCLVKLKANGSGRQEASTSITLLTKLQVLSLAGCKAGESNSRNLVLSLRSSPTEGLPLPSLSVQKSSLIARASIKYSRFMGHTSLETFSYPSSAYALKESRFIFYCYNCFRLVGNEQSDSVEAILLGIRLVASVPKSMAPIVYGVITRTVLIRNGTSKVIKVFKQLVDSNHIPRISVSHFEWLISQAQSLYHLKSASHLR